MISLRNSKFNSYLFLHKIMLQLLNCGQTLSAVITQNSLTCDLNCQFVRLQKIIDSILWTLLNKCIILPWIPWWNLLISNFQFSVVFRVKLNLHSKCMKAVNTCNTEMIGLIKLQKLSWWHFYFWKQPYFPKSIEQTVICLLLFLLHWIPSRVALAEIKCTVHFPFLIVTLKYTIGAKCLLFLWYILCYFPILIPLRSTVFNQLWGQIHTPKHLFSACRLFYCIIHT